MIKDPVLKRSLLFERGWWKKGYSYLLGVDEVGRGALAGPVVVGGVVITKDEKVVDGVDDSKKLTDKSRRDLTYKIRQSHKQVGIGEASQQEIDKLGIVAAIELAIRRLLNTLDHVDAVLIDGHFSQAFLDSLQIPSRNYIKGDEKSYAIAAASIVAKVYRDDVMISEHEKNPLYFWKENKGYGTKDHRQAIQKNGACDFHRKSFIGNISDIS